MQDYRVELDTFSGPLDLLLFLVRRDEIDLRDIPIARLAEQYLEYLKKLEQIDVSVAGEFLVMAATLLEIKSTMLLPPAQAAQAADATAEEPADTLDPRLELVQQLLAYKRFKDAALDLERRLADWQERFPRRPFIPKPRDVEAEQLAALERAGDPTAAPAEAEADLDESAGQLEFDLEDANVLDLAEAFSRIMESIGKSPFGHQVTYDDTPISLHADDILDRLQREGPMTLQTVFEGRSRSERIGLFLAMLELTRQRKIRVQQDELGGSIQVDLRPPEDPAAAADGGPQGEPGGAPDQSRWLDPVTGKMQYDWPDEESKQIAERRAKFRMNWLQKKKAAEAAGSPLPSEGQEEDQGEDAAPEELRNDADEASPREDENPDAPSEPPDPTSPSA